MVTAFVPSFSETTVDGDPGDWGDLAPLVPDYRWSLAVSGTDSRTVQKIEMTLTADGTAHVPGAHRQVRLLFG